ncbi:MAG TPA: hypothetical protein VM737_04955 [Gemmatimonadota bacterium]|nr:hypothetical protein [Gemmatimonadota bacterium]
MRRLPVMASLSLLLFLASTALAQQRPLRTEDPEPVPAGHVRAQAGVDGLRDMSFPVSGLRGDLVRLPYLELGFGLGEIAEFQLASGFNLFRVDEVRPAPLSDDLDFTGDTTTDIEDPVIGTKIRMVRETPRGPSLGFRVATRLPSASNESGLGKDAFDWYLTLLAGKSFGATRLVGNFGMGVLSIPTDGDRQNDVLTYGVSVVHSATPSLALVGELNGRADVKGETPPGTEDQGRALVGFRWALGNAPQGALRLDGGILTGLHTDDPDLGGTIGMTWEFEGFSAR